MFQNKQREGSNAAPFSSLFTLFSLCSSTASVDTKRNQYPGFEIAKTIAHQELLRNQWSLLSIDVYRKIGL